MPKKHKTWCSSLDWWLFHTGPVVSIQVLIENFKIVNNLWIGFFACLANCVVTLFPTLHTTINTQLWEKTVTCDIETAQYEDVIVKCEKKRSKRTTKCDKRTVTCDVETAQCEDETVKCEKK